jgi:hypothetical protein
MRSNTILILKLCCLCLLILAVYTPLAAQKKSVSLKDSLDEAFDLSDYIIDTHGFIPIPLIITEPALGGFGGALIPVFIKRKPPYIDSIKGGVLTTPIAPDITGGILAYTANNSHILAGFRSGTLIKPRIKYLVGGAYAYINMSFYRTIDQLGEKEFKINIKSLPLFLQASKRIGLSRWYAGMKYLFLKTETQYDGASDLDSLAESMAFSSTISQLGTLVELDNRDNIFTPDKGMKLHLDGMWSDNFLGSDYDYWKLNYYGYGYTRLFPKWIGGLRLDGQQTLGEPPFYLLPFLDMRGLPSVRYQGKATLLTEGELRWDFVKRWSLMFYGGTGKALDDWNKWNNSDWVFSYGTGFRYLLARKFKLRAGIDLARGPESWAYYIVFGSKWLK